MLNLLRRFSKSPLGLAVFGLIIVAFVVTLYEGRSAFGGTADTGGGVARVGDETIPENEFQRRLQVALEGQRGRNPTLTMPAFLQQGGLEAVLDQVVGARAVQVFAEANGMRASKKLVDGAIASIPAFNGPTGQFDPNTFQAILAERKINEKELRADFAREALTRQLLVPISGGVKVPAALAQPYAALFLETRQGRAQALPLAAFASNAPVADGDLQTFYARNLARYTIPEQRVIRTATFDRALFEGKVAPTEAEIAADYRANAARYASRQTRSFTQAIIADQAAANQVLAKVRGGTSFADALRPLGLTPQTIPATDKPAFARLTSSAVADAAFMTAKGAVAPLARSGFGFHVVRVDNVAGIALRSLAEARPEIAERLGRAKVDNALADLVAKIEEAADDGATFDDLVRQFGLVATALPPVTAAGAVVDQPAFKLPPQFTGLLRDAFQAEPDDEPVVASAGQGSYALWDLDRVVAAAPRPLPQVRAQVEADIRADRARAAARAAGTRLVASVNAGQPLQAAVGALGLRLPAPQTLSAKRIDLGQGGQPPAPLVALFTLAQGRARLVPGGGDVTVVTLDRVVPGEPAAAAALLPAVQAQLARQTGEEYVQQFMSAVRAKVGVRRDQGKLDALKRNLSGQAR